MEQVEGGDLVVNKGEESKPKEASKGQTGRDLGPVEGFDAALKLAQANIEELVKNNPENASKQSSSNPTTYSQVYLRLQPYLTSLPSVSTSTNPEAPSTSHAPTHMQFLLYLTSPSHSITQYTTTQTLPKRWVDAFQAEDAAGKGGDVNAWVEDVLVDILRVGLEVIGQEYIAERMGWGKAPDAPSGNAVEKAAEEKAAPAS